MESYKVDKIFQNTHSLHLEKAENLLLCLSTREKTKISTIDIKKLRNLNSLFILGEKKSLLKVAGNEK